MTSTPPRPVRGGVALLARHPWLAGAVLALASLLAYLPGLHGPFLFDDTPNIVSPLSAWLRGDTGWNEFVFGNRSGPLGRVVSMLTFAANGATTGATIWPFKLTNLFVHLLCGFVLYRLLALLLPRDRHLAAHTRLAATLIAAVWLLHPLQVSTVLYVVQRMAQLSTLFTLLALWAFVAGRLALDAGRLRPASVRLFVLVPVATLFALASKENGALVPLLCAVLEIAYFRQRDALVFETARERQIRWLFLGGFIVVPIVAALAYLALRPGIFLNGYAGRLFTFGERMLSEPRALLDYVGVLLVPRGAAMGLYTDDFPLSRGLLDPPSTLLAILALLLWIVASIAMRKRLPGFFAGTLLFFAAHAMESTVFPLEIYFEHRNYLPSIGLFLAVASLLAVGMPSIQSRLPARSRVWPFATCAALGLLALATATWIRATVWSTTTGIAEQGVREHPFSRRANLDKLGVLLKLGWTDEARGLLERMLEFPDPHARSAAIFNLAWLNCASEHAATPADIQRLDSLVGKKLQLADLFGGETLGNLLLIHECQGLSRVEYADLLRRMADDAQQVQSDRNVWRLRFMSSRLYAAADEFPRAIEQSALGWMTGAADPAVGVFLVNLYYVVGDRQSTEVLLPQVESRIPDWDLRNHKLLAEVKAHFSEEH